MESDKREAERLAQLESDKREAEHLAQLESDRKEEERLAQLKSDKKEKQRLAKLVSDNKEAELIAKLEANNEETPSFFQKYFMPIIGISVVIVGLTVWQLSKPQELKPLIRETSTQPQNNTSNNTSQGTSTIVPKTLPPNVTVDKPEKKPFILPPNMAVGKPVDQAKTQPSTTTSSTKAEADKQAENKKILEDTRRIAEQMNRQEEQIKADKTAALRYLQNAYAYNGAEDFGSAKIALLKAKEINTLSGAVKKAIQTAFAYTGAEDKEKAKRAIEEAKKIINAN